MVTKNTKAKAPATRFVTVPMPEDLYTEAKTLAAEQERALVSLIRLAIKEYLGFQRDEALLRIAEEVRRQHMTGQE